VVRPLLGKHLPYIEADRAQIHQVIMNLVINGVEACGEQDGLVTVMTSTLQTDRSEPAEFGLDPVQSGTFVKLEVTDTGCGMSEEIKARIFDPFFSTKFTGRGLGLSAVLGIIRAHKGTISVDTTPGQGTTFRMLFPATKERPVKKAAPDRASSRNPTGSGVVLVVDDEEVVRRVAKMTLERHGYTVALAVNGQSGVETFRGMYDRVVAVILDLTMPVMGGEETLAELKRVHPGVKVILSTGYSESDALKKFAGQGLAGFLQKPYTAVQLAEEVKNVVSVSGQVTR
jgi:CheY-like chemotaxis protein